MANYKNNSIPNHVLGNSNILPQTYANQSTFNLSEDLKTTIAFDNIYPVYWEELNPGDKFEVSVKTLARLMPMVAPTMSNIKLKYFAFFVPNRLLWKDWTKFMGERIYQEEVGEFAVPQVYSEIGTSPFTSGSLADYLGVVPGDYAHNVSAFPFRAYDKIWNEWFRCNEIQPAVPVEQTHASVNHKNYVLRKKGKPLDYFTSCLPYPQSGEPVTIPLTGDAPVMAGEFTPTMHNLQTDPIDLGFAVLEYNQVPDGTALYADMSAVTGVSVEMLRKASALQVLLEKDARAGETYVDLMNVHYGVNVPDFLVGRSQYLGSQTVMLNVEPIAQTGGTSESSPQGNLAGVGIGVDGGELCEISAVEHGIFMIMACVDGEVSYSQGIPRKFNKIARFDYMFPEFHNLGDQAVLNKEIFITGDDDTDNKVFGYQERYRELRESTNKVTGLMRPNVEGSLDVWHLGQNFANVPTLNQEFVECNTPISRVMAVPTEDQVILNAFFDIKATRTLPVTSNPSLLAGRV